MALDINTGYNDTFKAFADFAQQRINAGEKTAIARVGEGGGLASRTISAATTDSLRNIFNWTRADDNKAANDRTRALFKNAIIEMFGGESKIPASVRKAMLLGDYNAGKPLTARRIMAVKAAIDADGTAKTHALETFESRDSAAIALNLGYTKAELPKLARATHLYAQATGMSEMNVLKEVAEPGTKANRLMNYGGRFLADAESFQNGLRLMDSFATWFKAAHDTKNADQNTLANAKTVTDLNLSSSVVKGDSLAAFERFIFEDLAVNPNANLAEQDPEKIFGMKDNAAMRFFGAKRYDNFAGVMAAVPPQKRGIIFAVFDKFAKPLAETKEAALALKDMDPSEKGVRTPSIVIGRILRHFPEMEKLAAKGALTERNIVKTLFPELSSENWNLHGMNEFTHNVDVLATQMLMDDGTEEEDARIGGQKVQLIMEETCCTLQEAYTAYKTGKRVAPPPYMTTATFGIEKLDGTTKAARALLDGDKNGDLWRAYNYAPADDPENPEKVFIKDLDNLAFGFNFPDGTALRSNAGAHKGNILTILNKLESLAGNVHPRQQSALMFAVSQAGTGVLKGGLVPFGIHSSEHASVNFSFSKNDETGAITVKYSSPIDLPIRFEWTATIDIDGNMTSTPLKVDKPVVMSAGLAAKFVDDAAKTLGVKLTRGQKDLASSLVARFGTNMFEKNARLFAQFVVRLRLSESSAENDTRRAEDTANSIREWRSFDFGDHKLAPFNDAAKTLVQTTIDEHLAPESAGKFTDNIHSTMIADIPRNIYIINGTTYSHCSVDEVLSTFKNLVPDPKKQKAISTYMNQLCLETIIPPTNHIPLNTGVDAINLPGAGAIANRDMTKGLYMSMLHSSTGHDMTYDLNISEDGNTATIMYTFSSDLASPNAPKDDPRAFGTATFKQRITIDLSQEKPVVTDYQLSQTVDHL